MLQTHINVGVCIYIANLCVEILDFINFYKQFAINIVDCELFVMLSLFVGLVVLNVDSDFFHILHSCRHFKMFLYSILSMSS